MLLCVAAVLILSVADGTALRRSRRVDPDKELESILSAMKKTWSGPNEKQWALTRK